MVFVKRILGALAGLACIGLAASAAAQTATPYGQVPNAAGVVVSPSGDVFAMDSVTGTIFRVAPGGATTTAHTTAIGTGSFMLARAADGTLYAAREQFNEIYRVPANCVAPCAPELIATPLLPWALAVDAAGDLYVGSYAGNNILRYAAGCVAPCAPTTFATGITKPAELAFGPGGQLLVQTADGDIRAFSAGCVAPCTPVPYASIAPAYGWRGLTVAQDGSLYAYNMSTQEIHRIPSGGGASTLVGTYPELQVTIQIELDPSGTVLYAATQRSGSGLYAVQLPPPGPVPVPTLSEWAMILFGTLLAGGAALYLQRRRQWG